MIWVLGKGRRFRGVPFGAKTWLSVDRYVRERRKHKLAWRPSCGCGRLGALLRHSGAR
jgi:site-specific recombinase XerC